MSLISQPRPRVAGATSAELERERTKETDERIVGSGGGVEVQVHVQGELQQPYRRGEISASSLIYIA